MATTFWEKVDEQLANDAEALMKRVSLKYFDYIGPIRKFRLDQDWKYYEIDSLAVEAQPRVIIVRPSPSKMSFGSVRIVEGGQSQAIGALLWDIFTSRDSPAEGIYTGILPAGYICYLFDVEIKEIACPA